MLMRCEYKGRSDGLLRDTNGNERVLYSLRHTYASRRRFEGMSFDDLSVQMGTSVKMLEEHYSHFNVSDNPNLFSGHAKRELQNQTKEGNEMAATILKLTEQVNELTKEIKELRKQN